MNRYKILNIEVWDFKVVWVQRYIDITTDQPIYELCRTNEWGCGLWVEPCSAHTKARDKMLWSGGNQQLGTDQFILRNARTINEVKAMIRDKLSYVLCD